MVGFGVVLDVFFVVFWVFSFRCFFYFCCFVMCYLGLGSRDNVRSLCCSGIGRFRIRFWNS